jgi:hypothetical protein
MSDDLRDDPSTQSADEPDITMVDAGDRFPGEDPDFDETDPQDRDRDN